MVQRSKFGFLIPFGKSLEDSQRFVAKLEQGEELARMIERIQAI